MIAYLEDWLRMRAGAAPVFVGFTDGASGSFTMQAVDNAGIVLKMTPDAAQGVSYPWHAISSVTRQK